MALTRALGPSRTAPGERAAEPPHRIDDMAEPEPHDTVEPRGGDDGKMPSRGRKPNPPADAFPDQGSEHDDVWPEPQDTLQPPGSSIGARTGVPPSGEQERLRASGSRLRPGEDAEAVQPALGRRRRRSTRPRRLRTGAPKATAMSSTMSARARSDPVTDANPVEWRHVYRPARAEFPDRRDRVGEAGTLDRPRQRPVVPH